MESVSSGQSSGPSPGAGGIPGQTVGGPGEQRLAPAERSGAAGLTVFFFARSPDAPSTTITVLSLSSTLLHAEVSSGPRQQEPGHVRRVLRHLRLDDGVCTRRGRHGEDSDPRQLLAGARGLRRGSGGRVQSEIGM